jgi:GT2 family glycosyltransferase
MVDVYDATPKIGALGPKLLFEDEGLQHAGMFFARRGGGSEWWSEHFFKGLHRDLPAANVARPVPAVTAACLLTEAALYRRLGGLRSMYVQGGYEDSDFCLRLREEGLECWYLPDVELYHLEGQSYPSEARELSDPYNRWLLTQAWDDTIRATMEEFETAAQARTSASAAAP